MGATEALFLSRPPKSPLKHVNIEGGRAGGGGTCAWEMKTDAATSESEERAHVTSNERVSDCNIDGGWLADSLKGRRPLVQLPSSLRSSLQRDKLNMALTTTTTDIGAGRKSGKCLGGRDGTRDAGPPKWEMIILKK